MVDFVKFRISSKIDIFSQRLFFIISCQLFVKNDISWSLAIGLSNCRRSDRKNSLGSLIIGNLKLRSGIENYLDVSYITVWHTTTGNGRNILNMQTFGAFVSCWLISWLICCVFDMFNRTSRLFSRATSVPCQSRLPATVAERIIRRFTSLLNHWFCVWYVDTDCLYCGAWLNVNRFISW